jgi:hypothetical protein
MRRKSLHLVSFLICVPLLEVTSVHAAELARVPGMAQCSPQPDQAAYSKCLATQARERSSIVHASEQRVLDAIDSWNNYEEDKGRARRLFLTAKNSFSSLQLAACEVSAISAARGPNAFELRYKCQEQLDLAWLNRLQELVVQFRP